MNSRFMMEDPGLVPMAENEEMPMPPGAQPPGPVDMGGDPNAEPFDEPLDDGTMGEGPSPVVQMVEEGLAMLTPQEVAMLDQAITPQIAPILGKLLGPEFEAFIQPFAQPAGGGMAAQPMDDTVAASTGQPPETGTMPQHGTVGLAGGSVPGGALANLRA